MKLDPNNAGSLLLKLPRAPFIIYGMGYVGSLVAEWCDQNNIAYIFCDGNAKQKTRESGKVVLSPEQLAVEYPNANVVVASINYYDEIRDQLEQLGFEENQVLSYLAFWPNKVNWEDLEAAADWNSVRQRAEIFAAWIDPSASSVADYSFEKTFCGIFYLKLCGMSHRTISVFRIMCLMQISAGSIPHFGWRCPPV